MTVKQLIKPIKIQKLEAVNERLPLSHPQKMLIEDTLNRELAGYKGEVVLDYYLKFLNKAEFFILQNIRLEDTNGFFQIDALVISKSFMLIIDSKYLAGKITFDTELKQILQHYNGKEKVYSDPLLQVTLQENRLKKWMNKMKVPQMPLRSIVVFTNPSVLLELSLQSAKIDERIMRSQALLSRIEYYHNYFSVETIAEKEIKKLVKQIWKQHKPDIPDYLSKLSIASNDIIKGIQCDACFMFGMIRYNGIWICKKCNHKSKNAHLKALRDYVLIYSKEISNKQLREFLLVYSRSISQKILSSLKLKHTGTTKDRKYLLDLDDLQ
ncbi:nuclease-related domain-containing protein [Evansella sp. AB-P1]|uniref:nuclease-related domain-containing protein n=1 Tax=Evansella sp. AB-P1 TaxID=3037653 RepID=UPI00241ED689|nr:nuclease-related domain-containing protein [Evansella sp. AB-P1]MDG5788118.1 nuclease-related domain-containing protein [Evansella sp. AB-P1]